MQTIGERLEEARKRKGISIREAAEATKIRGDYLQRFENNQFDLNLADIYVRGFLRGYASFLKLPVDKILNDFNSLSSGTRAPRTPNREIYGRMDLSVASSDDEESESEPAPASSQSKPPQAPRRAKASFGKTGSGMPPGPAIDPNLVIKGGIVLVGVILTVLIVWGLVSAFSGTPDEATATAPSETKTTEASASPAVEPDYVLVALDNVAVAVRRGDLNASKELGPSVFSGQLERGRTQRLTRPGPYTISVSAPDKIAIEIAGQRLTWERWDFKDTFVLP